jgi:endonuclease I
MLLPRLARRFFSKRSVTPMALLLVAGLALTAAAAPPPGYYNTVDTTSPEALRTSLNAIISGHVRFPYTSSATDTWDVLELADQDPLNSSRILDLYRNQSHPKFGGGNDSYNREHTWPNSYGFPGSGTTPYTDCHHLFLCDINYNNVRANRPFDDCTSGCSSYATLVHDGTSGVNYTKNASPVGVWETWDGRKGDVARAILYMDVRYEGAGVEPDLIVTDNLSLIVASATGSNEPVAYMGFLSTLLEWHELDPPDDKERQRNDVIYAYQQNRNPFIDHPEWVDLIFGDPWTDAPDLPADWPAPVRIAGVSPNPFNPATRITYVVDDPGLVSLEVFTLDGRRVRTLAVHDHAAGEHRIVWDGRDEAYNLLASGSYLLRLSGSGAVDGAKLLLLK